MAEHPDDLGRRPFRVCLNGWTVWECATESDAAGIAIELKRGSPRGTVTILNLRAGLTIEIGARRSSERADDGKA